MLFGNKQQPLLGLDITTSSVKLIELSQSGKRYRVESYSAEPTPPSSVSEKAIVDAKAVGEAIRRAVKRAGAKATDVAVAISGDAAITKVIQMPSSLSDRDLEGQVEIQADLPGPSCRHQADYRRVKALPMPGYCGICRIRCREHLAVFPGNQPAGPAGCR